ncbi:MAG: hypothetical protein ACOYXN_05620 [Acidobacteriota bacterium]
MNWAHLHLIVNHAPVMGAFFVLALGAWAFVRRSAELRRASLLGSFLLAPAALLAFFSGREAEEVVEDFPEMPHAILEAHEEAALAALLAMAVAGLAAGAVLLLQRKAESPGRRATALCLVLLLAAAGLVTWAANLGGQIRHPEVRGGFSAPENPLEDGRGRDRKGRD